MSLKAVEATAAIAKAEGGQRVAKANILIVEDSEAQGAATKAFLEKNGYKVTWVLEGMAAFRVVKTEPIDVVLLDRVLPDMDGSRICGWLKQDEATRGIPIIMLTSLNSVAQKVQGLEAGADDYLAKPYDEIELHARVYAALRTKNLRDELSRKNEELHSMLKKVEVLSVTDPLTGLFNRRHFEDVLKAEFNKSKRYNSSLSCMMIDIDHFKSVNDAYGHAVGDLVIMDVVKAIQRSVRDVDTAARWGGEEFIVLAPMTTKAEAMLPARRILSSVSEHIFAGIGDKQITVSIGISDVSANGTDMPDNLIQAADVAMYEAKEKGRNRIELEK